MNPANCLVFEDIPEGIQAGLSAGMTVCAVQDDFSDYQIDEKKKNCLIITSIPLRIFLIIK